MDDKKVKRNAAEADAAYAEQDNGAKMASPRKRDQIAVVIVVLLAVFFWMYVQSTQYMNYEQEILGIRVELRNAENISSFVSGYETTIDVVLKGDRAQVENLTANDIKAFIDVSGVVGTAGTYALKVQFEELPSGVQVESQSFNTVIVAVLGES